MLPADAIHPKLEGEYFRLKEIADKKSGLLGGFSVLGTYLAAQLEVLKLRDMMLAHDFNDKAGNLMTYARGELTELAEVIPLLNHKAPRVDGVASGEGGDVAWFLAMRVGLAQLEPDKYGLRPGETVRIIGMMGIFDVLAKIYPSFDPESHAADVAQKVIHNYPDRVLRSPPTMSFEEMSRVFAKERLPQLKGLRSQLPGRKIPETVYKAIQTASEPMPTVEGAGEKSGEIFRTIVDLARQASAHYAY